MSCPDSPRALNAVRAYRMLIPLGVLATAAAVGASLEDEKSVLPPTTPASPTSPSGPMTGEQPLPTVKTARAQVEIGSLRAGPEPTAWAVPGRLAATFITNSGTTLEVSASAEVKGRADLAERVQWTIRPPDGFELPADAELTGPRLSVSLVRAGGNPSGAGDPLSLSVTARVEDEGVSAEASRMLTQDLRDRLRQEYVDLGRRYIPARRELLDEQQFRRLYAKKYPAVQFSEVNFTRRPGTEERYPYVMVSERLLATLHKTEKQYGRPLIFGSCYRNPTWQVIVHGSVGESHHQYGRAADLHVPPDSAAPKTGRGIAFPIDWLKLAAASLRGGGVWIEPMTDCNVNTAGCHVHVDVREAGNRSRVVQVKGTVLGPEGNPVPGASVRLAGMPAVTNARGVYTLKHVLYTNDHDLEVEIPGRPPFTQRVSLGGEVTVASVQVPSSPHPTLVARTVLASRGASGDLSLRVRLKNVGGSAARAVQLSASAAGGEAGAQVSPAHVPALSPGQEHVLQVRVDPSEKGEALDAGEMPLSLKASFQAPGGAKVQHLPVRVSLKTESPAMEKAQPLKPTDKETVTVPKAAPDLGAAAAGMAAGAAAAAAAAAARKKSAGKPEEEKKEPEPSALPETPSEPE